MVYVTFKNGEVQSFSAPNGKSAWLELQQDRLRYRIYYCKVDGIKGKKNQQLIAYVSLPEIHAIGFEAPKRIRRPVTRLT